jgi:hypothetical protein
MIEKLVGLPTKHIIGKFLAISLASSVAAAGAEAGYHKAFKLPIVKK